MKKAPGGAAVSAVDPFRLVGTRLDGKYAVEAMVAEGGFGVVYRCAHSDLQKTVALKVLKIPSHHAVTAKGEFFQKFANEARTIARIEHEAIVRVLDFGSSTMPSGELAPWMALEWLEGRTLERELDARAETGFAGRTPVECLALLHPVFEAVALAHEEGIAHRDIKPGNLMMVSNRRGELRLKLLDFGIAKVMTDEDRTPSLGQTTTQAHLQMFSLEYAAPEQLSGTRSGPWTDVHALALVLSEMLTGEQPYDGDDSVEIFSEALSRRRPTPGRRGLDVGPWESVLQRALALRPADRFPDAGALLKALLAEVPAQAVWRADLSNAPADPTPPSEKPAPLPSTEGPAPSPAPLAPPPAPEPEAPPVAVSIPQSERITTLLPTEPRLAIDEDDEPVRLPVHRAGWAAWLAAAVGVIGLASAVIITQRPPATRPALPVRPGILAVAAPALVQLPAPAPIPAPPTLALPPVQPSASARPSPPAHVSAPPPSAVVAPPALPSAARSPVRRVRTPRASDGRIPIE